MTRLVKIIDNKYVQIEEYRNPNICFNTNEYSDFEDYCTLRETFDPFEIFYENQKLKKTLEVGKEQYNDLVEEKESLQEQLSSNILQLEELKKQLEEYQLQNINLRADIMIQKIAFPNKLIKDKTFYNLYDMPTYEELLVQQKEFIKWLENGIEKVKNTEFFDERIQKAGLIAYNRCLQKYKRIIGISNEKENSIHRRSIY